MFPKRLFSKAIHHSQHNVQNNALDSNNLEFKVYAHYGIPPTASILAFDSVQRLLAIGTLDGRIKVIGGDGIEGLLISSKQMSFKYLEFLQNQGCLVSISNDNHIEVWTLESRSISSSLQWESNVTSSSVISGSNFIYIADEHGLLSVLKYDAEGGKLLQLPYQIPASSTSQLVGVHLQDLQPIVGVLHQPHPSANRILIAYESGLLILWDILEAEILFTGGNKNLQLKDGLIDSLANAESTLHDNAPEPYLGEKEISALCWASCDGSILAVGYVDGDILFWNTSCCPSTREKTLSSSANVVRLQLSSAERRLPVIVLHWTLTKKSQNNCDGLLFIYGGVQVGSDEVFTILRIEWSSGMETLRCTGHADIALNGSLADSLLVASTGYNHLPHLFVLTNPGRLYFYDDACISNLISHQEIKPAVCGVEFPKLIPTLDPLLTVAKLCRFKARGLSKIVQDGMRNSIRGHKKWPLTGGVPSQCSVNKESALEKIYIAGYRDGSVRLWDATWPVLSFLCLLQGKVEETQVDGLNAPASSLDFCGLTQNLAVGNESGLVHIFSFESGINDRCVHLISNSKKEANLLAPGKGSLCRALLSLSSSLVQVLQFSNDGNKLAVGFQCGQIVIMEMSSLSILFRSDNSSRFHSPVISLTWKSCSSVHRLLKSINHSEIKEHTSDEVIFMLTMDGKISMSDGGMVNVIYPRQTLLKRKLKPISMYVIDASNLALHEHSAEDSSAKEETKSERCEIVNDSCEVEHPIISGQAYYKESSLESLVLLCFEDSLRLYSSISIFQVNGCEMALVYLTTDGDDLRIQGSLPCLHDKVLAAAADAAFTAASYQNKKQASASGILGGIIKGFKAGKGARIGDTTTSPKFNLTDLEDVFSKSAFSYRFPAAVDDKETADSSRFNNDIDMELKIDDIDIDDPAPAASVSSNKLGSRKNKEEMERNKLLRGATDDTEPRRRTPEEIIAKYRKTQDASSVAAQARNKLIDRQDKLERISKRTEELQRGAEDFAALANELVKTMEKRKWWHI